MHKNLEELRRVQREVAERVIVGDLFRRPVTKVAGIDLAFKGDLVIAACVVVGSPSLEVEYEKTLTTAVDFPYIPTFLSFREGPAVVSLMNSLDVEPNVFLINAQGIAHPLFCGCASHVGVLTQKPTVGVATSNLCGEYAHEPREVGEPVSMRYGGRAVGWVLKSKRGCKPIFVSPGHLVGLESSLEIVQRCLGQYKLPVPLHLAHRLANTAKRRTTPRTRP